MVSAHSAAVAVDLQTGSGDTFQLEDLRASCLCICNKKAQLSLTNPRDAKACQKLLQFDVITTLS